MKGSTSKLTAASTSNNPFDSPDERAMQVISLADHSAMLGGAGAITFESASGSTSTMTIPPKVPSPRNPEKEESDKERKRRHREYNGLVKQELLAYNKTQKRLDWRSVSYREGSGITCDELPVTPDGIYTFRASGVVRGKKAQEIAERHLDCKSHTRLRWDKELSHIELLEEIDRRKGGILMTCQRAQHHPPIVADREFVYVQFSFSEPSPANEFDKKWTLLVTSVDHPNVPVRSDPVRALMMSMMVLEPFEPTTNPDTQEKIPETAVTLFGWVNPGGLIPNAVVTLYKTKLADRIEFLRNTLFLDEPRDEMD